MAKPPDHRDGKDPQDKKPPGDKAPSQQGSQGEKDAAAKSGERPIADVDRKVRGGDA